MREVFVKTEDNINIAINHYDSGRDEVLIIAHGWYMCKDTHAFLRMSEDFFKSYDVITMDFRGHGKSSGWYTFTSNEHKDIKAVVKYAREKYSKIAILGFSLGGALAIIHAATYKDINCLITVSTPTDFDKIENLCWQPEAFITAFQQFDNRINRNIRLGSPFLYKIRPIDIVQDISPTPILFLAGGKGPTFHPWHAEKLHEKVKQCKSIEIFENDFHAEALYLNSRKKFLDVCNDWLTLTA